MGPTIPMWLMPVLTGLCLTALGWIVAAQKKRDEAIADLKDCVTALELKIAKEYFGKDEAFFVSKKLDQVIEAQHAQSVVLAEVRTELRATRQAAQMGAAQLGASHQQ